MTLRIERREKRGQSEDIGSLTGTNTWEWGVIWDSGHCYGDWTRSKGNHKIGPERFQMGNAGGAESDGTGQVSVSQSLSLKNINGDCQLLFKVKSSKASVPFSQKVTFHTGARNGIYPGCQVLSNNLIKNCDSFLDNDITI